jgi:hypothetical protein
MEKVDEVMIHIAKLSTMLVDLNNAERQELAERCDRAAGIHPSARTIYSHMADVVRLEWLIRMLI